MRRIVLRFKCHATQWRVELPFRSSLIEEDNILNLLADRAPFSGRYIVIRRVRNDRDPVGTATERHADDLNQHVIVAAYNQEISVVCQVEDLKSTFLENLTNGE